MIKVNSYQQELRLPTLPDEAKAPKSNPQPLDQYHDAAPLLGDFGKFSGAQTGNVMWIAKGTDKDAPESPAPSTPDKPDKPAKPCNPTETTFTVKVGPVYVTLDHKKDCPAPAPGLGPKPGQ